MSRFSQLHWLQIALDCHFSLRFECMHPKHKFKNMLRDQTWTLGLCSSSLLVRVNTDWFFRTCQDENNQCKPLQVHNLKSHVWYCLVQDKVHSEQVVSGSQSCLAVLGCSFAEVNIALYQCTAMHRQILHALCSEQSCMMPTWESI